MPFLQSCFLSASLCLALLTQCAAQETLELAEGLEPEAAAARMTVPEGFVVRLAAGEPQIHQPVAMAIDARGRLWVAEAYTYPQRALEGQGRDRIVILSDSDRDGSLDHRTVFAENLNLISGLEVGFGGVWVGAAPYLMFIPDADQDDHPDGPPQILLDGFGYQDTHETLNAFIWGPDGWLYGCQGVFTHSLVGPPGTPDTARTPLNACVWRYHPVRREFEVFAWGTSNPWGVDFNDHGDAFITACVIPHLYHVVQGGRFQRQAGSHFGSYVFEDIKTIADHAHYTGDIRDHAWWGHEPTLPTGTSLAGGGHAHCGAMIYLGDNWPPEYRGRIFMNNVHGNRVNQDILEPSGSGYVGHHGPDLLMANDRWFRGINLRYGPDGSVYLIDWYDRNACHRTNPEIWDRTNGRIYNIAYGQVDPVEVDLNSLSDLQLAELQLHINDWFVRTARRILQHRARQAEIAPSAVARLQDILSNHPDVTRQLRAAWTLHVVDQLDPERIRSLLSCEHESLRCWAIQISAEDREVSADDLLAWAQLANEDPSPKVRLYLAAALQRLPLASRWEIVARLSSHDEDADDHNLPLMIWYAAEPLVEQDATRALAIAAKSPIPRLRELFVRRAAAVPATTQAAISLLEQQPSPSDQLWMLAAILKAFEGRVGIQAPSAWQAAYERLATSSSPEVCDLADQVAIAFGDQRIFPRLRARLVDNTAPVAARQEALTILVRGRDSQAAPALQQVLDVPALRGPALRALAAYQDTEATRKIIDLYDSFSDEEKRDAIQTLSARPASALALLDAVEAGDIPRNDLHAYHIRQLNRFEDSGLQQRIADVWGNIRATSADKAALIETYKQLLSDDHLATADASHGRRVFDKTCGSCHTLFGSGGKIGPDLTGSNRGNLDYLLENIVDPSAVLGKDYRMTLLLLLDGRVISGLVLQETDSALTVQTINDKVVIPKADVEERTLSEISMMPEQLLDPLEQQEVLDLVSYLRSPAQVPLRGPRSPIDPATSRVPGAIEGEGMKIVDKSRGQARSQPMASFAMDKWSGTDQLWWTGGSPGDRLGLELPVPSGGTYQLEVVLTRAPDYGIVQLWLDDQRLGEPVDLYAANVVTTGVLNFSTPELKPGNHRLVLEIVGRNPQAVPAHMVGLDYVRLTQPAEPTP